jgi:glycosyltransferase involved in cell wall biosynthesis
MATRASRVELSLVIPVYNGSQTIQQVVTDAHIACDGLRFEVILVNDGSTDQSEQVCGDLVGRYPDTVRLVQLTRNFGEHNAVLAGLRNTTGEYVAILDDDGQNCPQDVLHMLDHAKRNNLDVVYGRYCRRQHPLLRVLGSWFNDKMANIVLAKPPGLYLSSFKLLNRFVVDEVTKFATPFPYLDGLILWITHRIGQVEVRHCARQAGRSGYTWRKLCGLWLNMFLGFSTVPLRLSLALGFVTAALSILLTIGVVVDKLWVTPQITPGIPTALLCTLFFAGVQLVVLGTLGEYVGRVFLSRNGMPQYVVRYRKRAAAKTRTVNEGSGQQRAARAATPHPAKRDWHAPLRN